MPSSITLSAHTQEVPRHIQQQRNSPSADGCTSISSGSLQGHRPLYSITHSIKPRTAQVLVGYALERLAGFGIPTLANWKVEVDESDGSFQVDFISPDDAVLGVCGILLTANRCGVSFDHGVHAYFR